MNYLAIHELLDCIYQNIKMVVWKSTSWKRSNIHQNKHTFEKSKKLFHIDCSTWNNHIRISIWCFQMI